MNYDTKRLLVDNNDRKLLLVNNKNSKRLLENNKPIQWNLSIKDTLGP